MPRTHLLQLLKQYHPVELDEQIMLTKMIDFVEKHENCLSRSLSIGHVTGSAWIVNESRSHALLIHHAKLNAWFQPGGHADEGENITEVAMREAMEETGLVLQLIDSQLFDIDIHQIPARKSEEAHLHYDVRFLFEGKMSDILQISNESKDLRWIPLQEIEHYNNEASIMRMVEKTKN